MAISMYDKLDYGEFHLPSLQEMMVAPMYLTQKHEEMEDAFSKSQEMAADVATRFQPGIDDDAIQMNNQFQESINADVNALAKEGLTPGIRQRLLQRKADFSNNILPLNKAAVDREQWSRAAKEAKLRDPSLLIKDPMKISLKTWAADPNSHNLDPISGKDIYERTRQEMIPISKYINQNLPDLARSGIPYQYFTIARSGATPEEITSLMSQQFKDIDVSKLSPLASMIVNAANSVVSSTGVYDKYGIDSEEAQAAEHYATSAFNHALGTKAFGSMTDQYGLSLLKARSSGKGSDPESPIFYFPDRKGTELEVSEIKKLKDLKEKVLENKEDLNKKSEPYRVWVTSPSLSTKSSSSTIASDLKALGIDPSKYNNKEDIIKAIDDKIDTYGTQYGYTTFDDKKAKEQFINRVLPSLETGSVPAYRTAKDAVSGTNPLPKSAWFGKDVKSLKKLIGSEDSDLTNFSLEHLDNQGLLRIRNNDDIFYLKPEDIDQSEGGYYQMLRTVRGMSDSDFDAMYKDAEDKYRAAAVTGDEENANAIGNYLNTLRSLRYSTYDARTKAYAISTGENKPIQFGDKW